MTTSRVPVVIDALVTLLRAELSGTATVYDGGWVDAPPSRRSFITVGETPDDEGPTGAQEWAGLGNRARNETIRIPCYADAYSGSTATQARRNAAFALLSEVETAIRSDPTLGGVVPQPGWTELAEYTLRQVQTENGLEVGITFIVQVRARI